MEAIQKNFNFTLLQISDLHINKDQIADFRFVKDAFFKDLTLLKKEKQVWPDLVFIIGDLINKGENSDIEFKLAEEEFINPLMSFLNLSKDRFFIVPGNHEIDRTVTQVEIEKGFNAHLKNDQACSDLFTSFKNKQEDYPHLQKKLNKFLIFKNNFYKNHNNILKKSYFYDIGIVHLGSISLGIIGLNSAWRSSQFFEDKGNLIIGSKILEDAYIEIKDCDLKIVLSHHPLEYYTEWNRHEIKNYLVKNINLYMSGHMHDSDSYYIKTILGNLHSSTCASMFNGRLNEGYSLLNCNLNKQELTIILRKWYQNRKEFDQETDKSANGIVVLKNIKCADEKKDEIIKISNIRDKMRTAISRDETALAPLVYIQEEAKLEDVFVEPIISDKLSFTNDLVDIKYFKLKKIIRNNTNLVFFGGKEYGKSVLLSKVQLEILNDEKIYEDKIPVIIQFTDLPKNNYKTIPKLIKDKIDLDITAQDIAIYLDNGKIVLIIDDYDDPNDEFRMKRKNVFIEFCNIYKESRIILTMNDNFAKNVIITNPEIIEIYNASKFFLKSFNSAKIRELLRKWNKYREFDVDQVLNQILFYFKQLRIPVTPLAVTLFLGVLFKDPNNREIKNEAYLIENYLETVLEKLNTEYSSSELDFHDKISFLAHMAFHMVKTGQYPISKNEFEKEKIQYFDNLGLDAPKYEFFEDFFKRGILTELNSKISFKFRFWFYFFIAKSMSSNKEIYDELIQSSEFLKYATAFAYKSGLVRNDLELLTSIDSMISSKYHDIIKADKDILLETIDKQLMETSNQMEADIRQKNDPDIKDKLKDIMYLSEDIENQELEIAYDEFIRLVVLNSEIIRNTTNIGKDLKEVFLKNNVDYYKVIIWKTIEEFETFIHEVKPKDIEKAIFGDLRKKPREFDAEKIIECAKRIVCQIIPLSIIQYMSEKLSTSKLKNIVVSLLEKECSLDQRLFYSLLLLKLNLKTSTKYLNKLIKISNNMSLDFLVLYSLIYYCHINYLSEDDLNKLLRIIEKIQQKYSPPEWRKKKLKVAPTWISTLKKSLQKAQKKLIN